MVTMGGEGTQAAGGVRVMSINVGRTRPLRVADALSVESGIVKRSISNEAKPIAVEVRKLGLAGNEQADPSVQGGWNQSVAGKPMHGRLVGRCASVAPRAREWVSNRLIPLSETFV